MSAIRVISRLDVKGPNLVKGIHLEGLRVLGNPQSFAKYYYEMGADEIFYMDVVASLYDRNGLKEIISQTSKDVFIPITVGGGLRTVEDIREVLKIGADKVCLNTAAIRNPNLITEAALRFGSSTIVIALEIIKQPNGEYFVFTDNGREFTGIEAVSWAKKVEQLGAGELVVTSVDKDGTGEGFDLNIIKTISANVGIPVIAHGGAGNANDVVAAVESGADAVALASVIHYYAMLDLNCKIDQAEGNTTFLNSGKTFKKIKPYSLSEIKETMSVRGVEVRRDV